MTAEGKIASDGASAAQSISAKQRAFIWIPCIALVLLSPWPAVKIMAGMAGLLSLGITSLKRPQAVLLLASLFSLAYLASPYGLVAASASDSVLVLTLGRTAVLFAINAILLALALFWSWLASGEVRPSSPIQKKKTGLFDNLSPWILAVLVLAANLLALRSEVPIQGDEGWHIWRARLLRGILDPLYHGTGLVVTCAVIVLAFIALLAARRLPLAFRAGLIGLLGLSAGFLPGFQSLPHQDFVLARYPFISVWLHQTGLVWDANAFTEGVYRLIPMLAVFAMGWFILWASRKEGIGAAGLGFGLAFVLVPNLYYHSTILYLELPALALLLVVLYYLDSLLTADFRSVRTCPGWYALLALGFFKETLVFFIFGIIALRLAFRLVPGQKSGRAKLRALLPEAAAVLCMALPLGIYFIFRASYIQTRGYHINLSNLLDWELYAVAAKALFIQFGGVLILALGGLIVSIGTRRTRLVLPVLFLFLFHAGMHFLDRKLYIGLARFNLFLFAPLAILALEFIVWLKQKQPKLLWLTAVLCMALNLALSPISITGEKRSGWVTPIESHSSEYYIPYHEMLKWIKTNRPEWPVLLACSFSRHLTLDWYFEKAGYDPSGRDLLPGVSGLGPGFRLPRLRLPGYLAVRIPSRASSSAELHQAMRMARQLGYPLMLYHRKEGTPDVPDEDKEIARFRAVHATASRDLSLVLYQTLSIPREYFPYQAAIAWLQAEQHGRPILIGGTLGKTRLEWHFSQAGYRPRRRAFSLQSLESHQEEVKAAVTQARKIGFPLVLFHRIGSGGGIPEGERNVDGYEAVKIFENTFHKTGLVVYKSLDRLETLPSPTKK